ncbi:hypothetical protein [Actinomadura mexicana]|nr:hypothetical protein [Actinomadura mexicana]
MYLTRSLVSEACEAWGLVRLLATGGCGYRHISGGRGKVVWARPTL